MPLHGSAALKSLFVDPWTPAAAAVEDPRRLGSRDLSQCGYVDSIIFTPVKTSSYAGIVRKLAGYWYLKFT